MGEKFGYNQNFITSLKNGSCVTFPIVGGRFMWSATSIRGKKTFRIKVFETKQDRTKAPMVFVVNKEYVRKGEKKVRCLGPNDEKATLCFENNWWYFTVAGESCVEEIKILPVYINLLSK